MPKRRPKSRVAQVHCRVRVGIELPTRIAPHQLAATLPFPKKASEIRISTMFRSRGLRGYCRPPQYHLLARRSLREREVFSPNSRPRPPLTTTGAAPILQSRPIGNVRGCKYARLHVHWTWSPLLLPKLTCVPYVGTIVSLLLLFSYTFRFL